MADKPAASSPSRYSCFVIRNAKWIVLLWALIAILTRGTAPSWKSLALDGDFEYLPADRQSVVAEQVLNQAFPADRARSQIVIVVGRESERFDRADELASLDLLRRLHHRLAEVLIQRAGRDNDRLTSQQASARRDRLRGRAKESLDEAIRIDEAYFSELQKTENRQALAADTIRLTLAYWDRAQLLQTLGDDDASAFDMQAALTLDPDIAKHATEIQQRDLQAWSTLLDLISWNDPVIGSRLLQSRARLIVLQSDAELAATHNIEFLDAVRQQIAATKAAHQPLLRPELQILTTGSAAIGGEALIAARDAIRYTEWFTVLIILVILVLVYRSPLLIAIPLVSIGLAVAVSTGVIAWLTVGSQAGWLPGLDMQIFTTSRIFLFVILFGAGTDYCLFLIARVREEVARWPWEAAVIRSLSGVSSALLGSALTTVVGLGMLWIAEFGKYHHTGPMIAICLLIGLAVCMTLTPALLYLVGPRVFWPQPYGVHASQGTTTGESPAGLWGLIALRLTARPGLALVVGCGLLMIPALYGWANEDSVTYDFSSQLTSSAESRRGFRKLDEHFGIGEVNPTTVLLVHQQAQPKRDLSDQARDLAKELYSLDGVRGVRSADDPLGDFPPERYMSLLSKDAWKRRALRTHRIAQDYFFSTAPDWEGRLVRLDVVMEGNPFDIRTADRVQALEQWLRTHTTDAASFWAGAEVHLAGTTPSIIDLRSVTLSDHRRIKLAVVLSVFVVLVVVIRRLILCGYLIATVLLSYYATLGITVLFFRWVYGDDYVGLDWKLPLFLFVILVAIGQDYNVYLVTRILQEQRQRSGWLSAIRHGISKTGGIITACGMVMAGTFFSMTASAWFPALKEFVGIEQSATVATLRGVVELGFALGLGVLIDTFYVRTLLVPAFIALFDRFASVRSKGTAKQVLGGVVLIAGTCWGLPALTTANDQVLGMPGASAVYELESPPVDRPEFETRQQLSVVSARLRLGPVVTAPGQPTLQWYNLDFSRQNGDTYRLWILMDGWPTEAHAPLVARYLWQEPGWSEPLEFVHELQGTVQLPRLDLWTYGWPQQPERAETSLRAPVTAFPDRLMLHGWVYRKVRSAEDADVHPPGSTKRVPLNPDLLNGWVAFDRDRAGRPHYRLGKSDDGPPKGYDYVAKTAEDLIAFRDVGANFLVTHPGKRARANFPDWLTRSSMYHNNLAHAPTDWPADLYRPNYWGFSNHIDEPGVHNWGLRFDSADDAPLPEVQAVKHLQQSVKQAVQARGRSAIARHVGKNFGLGDLSLQEGPESIVSWEYEWPTAWYQLAVKEGVGGIVDEDVANNDLVESYNMGLGTSIPPTVENAVAIRVAILRGAARNFDKKWGIAFYHPNEVKLKSSTIPLVYNKGAAYFWYWTGWIGITDNSGLPYPYQTYYSSLVREAFLRNPARNQRDLLRAARIAVVIPFGYTFTPYAMHRIDWLHLERENQFGVSYRQVLSHAGHEVERLLRLGLEFDIVVDDPEFHGAGYDELIYVQADSAIRIERPGQPTERLEEPRPVSRPDMGPGPRLSIEVQKPEVNAPQQVRFRAIGKLGTGEWAGERPDALVAWEMFGPDNRVHPATFPEYGAVYTLTLDQGAMIVDGPDDLQQVKKYTVRAALTDVFGRPAVAYQTIYVRPKP